MEHKSKIKNKNPLETYIKQQNDYLDKLNKIVEYINNTIAKDKNNPFTGCEVYQITDPEEMYKWEVYITNNGKISTNEYPKWHEKFIKQIIDYAEKHDCISIVNDMVFLI